MTPRDWRAFAKANGIRLVSRVPIRLYLTIAGVVSVLVLLSVARCEGERAGRAEVEAVQWKRAAKLHQRSADSLLSIANYRESLIKDKALTVIKAKVVYRKVRDSVNVVNSLNPTNNDLFVRFAAAADSVIAGQDSVITAQASVILTLKEVVSEKDLQIRALNRSLATIAKPSRVSRIANASKFIGVGVVLGLAVSK